MAAKKEAMMRQVQMETDVAQAQELMNTSTEKCFTRCIVNPGTDLSAKDKACLASCFDKFLETFNVVGRTYTARITKERQAQHHNLSS
ncbi:hypothetical protein FA15DRAFT_665702 [Coprinopsis marcescibilis]|uniref:Mitochondrial import inner membrane translocase subunit n=1 Tax=Coprinopsis marcescibilis TaxID=230819 RepID=A0A5C3L664_COPMA|nr:hypothetical protein FA15DRAFT_665702 [Coprinopsis marcescibilis]